MPEAFALAPTVSARREKPVTTAQYKPGLGDTVEDTQRQAIGRVMGFVGPYVQVRPVDGGREWDALPDRLRPVPLTKMLSVGVAAANARSLGGATAAVNAPFPLDTMPMRATTALLLAKDSEKELRRAGPTTTKSDKNEEDLVSKQVTVPFGLTRMRPFPDGAVLAPALVVLDPKTQIGRWLGPDGLDIPELDRHKRSETSKETKTKTSLDGNPDERGDQQGDSD
ncbi:putative ATP-grasp-modified RiPP [Streptomyces sp. CWNU-52B]|uniref:putative ATP-grasp-modified RiPP n=1 Tax=unclassified Streptomyces TaxID=2593676 RepID=UPI0039C26907